MPGSKCFQARSQMAQPHDEHKGKKHASRSVGTVDDGGLADALELAVDGAR